MSNYNKWLESQPHCRGLSLRMAFEGGRRDMLEKVDVKCGELSRVDFTDWVDDQLAKEAGHE